jgi:glycosyltransferase involved in cell wall biosynthesis
MAASVEGTLQTQTIVPPTASQRGLAAVRMVVGVTSDQTCLVLADRLRALQAAGFAVTLVASPGEFLDRIAYEEGVRSCPIRMRRGIAPFADLCSFVKLFSLLWRERPEITDFSTPKAGLLGNLAAWMLGVPHRVYTLRGLKLESTRGWKRRLLLWSERVSAWCAHVVLCNSESLRAEAMVLRIASANKLQMLGEGSSNGVDTQRFMPGKSTMRQELEIPDDGVVLGFVGRLTKNKGVAELLIAFDEILRAEPKPWLLLVGWFDRSEDALDPYWRQHITQHPRIRPTGYVADAAAYYRAMDVFVLPTHREGFPNAVLEASASGLAVITTQSTGARDAVLAEVTGLLIPLRSPEAITEAVLELIRNPEKRRRMGEAGRAWVIEKFSRERVLGLAVEFYRGLLGQEIGSRE